MQLFYTDQYVLPLPPGHRFPMQKYALLREALQADDIARNHEFCCPPVATPVQIERAHSAAYLEQAEMGRFTRDDLKRLGFPWSPELIERSKRSSGATISAAHSAIKSGFSANLAGGTHHAFYDRAEGYCIFNDSVIAARDLQAHNLAQRILIVDADVHQGNGTAALTRDDDSIYAFSIHSERNYPFPKEESDLDIGLPDETGDGPYLEALNSGLRRAFAECRPDFVFYLAGADPYHGDRMGRLALSKAGLLARDEMVFAACRQKGLPVVVSMAGGYCPEIQNIVDIHQATIRTGLVTYR